MPICLHVTDFFLNPLPMPNVKEPKCQAVPNFSETKKKKNKNGSIRNIIIRRDRGTWRTNDSRTIPLSSSMLSLCMKSNDALISIFVIFFENQKFCARQKAKVQRNFFPLWQLAFQQQLLLSWFHKSFFSSLPFCEWWEKFLCRLWMEMKVAENKELLELNRNAKCIEWFAETMRKNVSFFALSQHLA